MEPAPIEVDVESLDGLIQKLAFRQMRLLWSDGDGVADAVLGVLVGKLCDGQARGKPTVAVSAMHRIRSWPERLAFSAAMPGVSRSLGVSNVRSKGENVLGVRGGAIGGEGGYFFPEAVGDVLPGLLYHRADDAHSMISQYN